MQRLLRATALATAAAAVLTGTLSTASAQTGAKFACAALLTSDEITKAVGFAFTDMGPQERNPGETECPWMLRGGAGGFKTVSLQFYDMSLIKRQNETPEQWFEEIVAATEGVSSKKRELLPGIGQKAAFVAADPQVLAVVQRADGVARIVGNNLTKAQITAVARAVATP